MIASPRRSSLKLIFSGLSFVLSFFVIQNTPTLPKVENRVLGIETEKVIQGSPVRLIIPRIHVDTAIDGVGVDSSGSMETPSNTTNVSWFNLGPLPGEKGSAVIAGHLNGKNGEAGIFANLDKLKEGDVLYVEDDQGKYRTFSVREASEYKSGYADEVFSQNDKAHLNLITCDGVWNSVKKTYSKRLVVFTDLVL